MLRLPVFTFHRPGTVDEAVELLGELPEAMLVAGGTDLLPNMKRKLFTPKDVIGIGHLPELAGIQGTPDAGWRVGAGTLLETVAEHEELPAALRTAAASISTPQLRNMGTIGGNLCLDTRCNYYNQSYFWRQALGFCMKKDATICRVATSSPICLATYSADTVPVLSVLNASIALRSTRGEREVRVADLYQNDGMRFLRIEKDEVLTEVRIPPLDGLRSTYMKLRDRESFDFPIAGVAVGLRMDGLRVAEARVSTTGIFSAPLRLTSVEEGLRGQELTRDVIEAAAGAGYREVHPVDNTSGTIIQRKSTVRVFIRRALNELAAR
ncbi:MAG: FAD binding domain-containing protein [Chloroflexi bacterium]|nr:FAD binding domain-containing protein [Chloroflexota bacterium]